MVQRQGQDVGHLAVAAGTLEQARLQGTEAGWQFAERRAVAQRTGLTLHHGQEVAGQCQETGIIRGYR